MATDWSDDIAIAELANEPALSEELNTIIERAGSQNSVPHVVLNLAGVSYLNSSNIAQLLKLHRLLSDANRRLKLCHVSDEVWSVLMVTGLDKYFQFAPDTMTALAGLQLDGAESGE
jgi:anti-sigma B factor antagonist